MSAHTGQSRPLRLGWKPGLRQEVLLVSPPVAPPYHQGISRLARDLAAGGHDFDYRVMGFRGQQILGGRARVEPVYGTGPGRGFTAHIRLMARLIRPDRCGTHHFLMGTNPGAATATRMLLKVTGKPSVHTLPALPEAEHKVRDLMFGDRIVTLTEATALLLRSAGLTNVSVIRPGMPVAETRTDKMLSRARLNSIPGMPRWEDATVFLCLHHRTLAKGSDTFIHAAELVASKHNTVRFALVNIDRDDGSHESISTLRKRVRDAGLMSRMCVLEHVDDMDALLGAIDVIVLPAASLGPMVDTPYPVLKSMALGKPAILSTLPTLDELHGLGEGTLTISPGAPHQTADQMNRLVEDHGLTQRVSVGAKETIRNHFRPDEMVASYEEIYRELMA